LNIKDRIIETGGVTTEVPGTSVHEESLNLGKDLDELFFAILLQIPAETLIACGKILLR
jgi:hypothetical protein